MDSPRRARTGFGLPWRVAHKSRMGPRVARAFCPICKRPFAKKTRVTRVNRQFASTGFGCHKYSVRPNSTGGAIDRVPCIGPRLQCHGVHVTTRRFNPNRAPACEFDAPKHPGQRLRGYPRAKASTFQGSHLGATRPDSSLGYGLPDRHFTGLSHPARRCSGSAIPEG